MHKSEDCLCWPLRLTEGLLLHVPWGTLGAAEPWLLTFLSCSEGLTVPLAAKEEASALPWRRIFYSHWQLWQLVMAACWWESQALLPLTSVAITSPQLLLTTSQGELEIPETFFFFVVLTVGQCDGKLKYQYFLLQKRETRFHYKCGAGWVTGWSLEAHKTI